MSHSATEFYEAGEVVLVDLSPTIGAEKDKVRPCAVLEGSGSKIGLCIVVPITNNDTGNRKSPIFVPVIDQQKAGLSKPSVVDTYQIRALDKIRIRKRLGHLDEKTYANVLKNLALIIGIDRSHAPD